MVRLNRSFKQTGGGGSRMLRSRWTMLISHASFGMPRCARNDNGMDQHFPMS